MGRLVTMPRLFVPAKDSTVRTRPTLLSVDQGRGWSLSASWPSFWVRGGSGQVIPTASRNPQLSTRQVSRNPRPVSRENLEGPVMSPPERSESEDESPGAKRGGKVPPADGRGEGVQPADGRG